MLLAFAACASAKEGTGPDAGDDGSSPDMGCGQQCDADHDGVVDSLDQCPNSSALSTVNMVGCAEAQLPWELQPFPPFGLTWTPSGDLGRVGGLTWNYVGIDHGNLFHIDWVLCDDPATPCGLSLDGPIDPLEKWFYSASESDLAGGKLVFTNSTFIALDDGTMPARAGRLTVTAVDGDNQPIPFATLATLGVTAQDGAYGMEIKGSAFTLVALAEIQDPATLAWTPYLDYYDAAPTSETGAGVTISFGGSFYAK